MAINLVTKEDLEELRMQLINDLRQLLAPQEAKLDRPWLRNSEVRKPLKISANTIQTLRITGKLPSSKVGGIHYYRCEDIKKLLNSNAA